MSDLAHTDTVHVPLSTSKASTITLSFTFASSGSPDSHIVYLVPLGEKTARSRSWTSCLAEKEVAAGSIQESVTRKSKPAVPFTSKRYSCNVSSGMEVLAASATKRTKLPSPSSGIPCSRWTRPKPRNPSGSELPPMRFALLINSACLVEFMAPRRAERVCVGYTYYYVDATAPVVQQSPTLLHSPLL